MRYSQNNEQEIILDYLRGKVGTFLDLGANDGVTLSNTRALAEIGWSGVLIEASPQAFKRLQENYTDPLKHHLYNFAIGSFNGIVEFNESGSLLGNDDVALVSTLNESEMNRFKKVVHYEKVEAKCLTWEAFIHGCPVKHFQFISMDIEGSELEVIPFMDFSATELFCVETNSSVDKEKEILKYTSKYGLKNVIYRSGENIIVCK